MEGIYGKSFFFKLCTCFVNCLLVYLYKDCIQMNVLCKASTPHCLLSCLVIVTGCELKVIHTGYRKRSLKFNTTMHKCYYNTPPHYDAITPLVLKKCFTLGLSQSQHTCSLKKNYVLVTILEKSVFWKNLHKICSIVFLLLFKTLTSQPGVA